MLRPALLSLSLLLFSCSASGQATRTESQTLEALLAEVHKLREDLETAATGARRAQILIYRLHVQEAVVERASQRLDEAESALDQLQARRNWEALQIKKYEDKKDHAENAAQRQQLEGLIASLKAQLEEWSPEEQEAQSKHVELAERLRIEQAKLEQLENELDRMDRAMMSAVLGTRKHASIGNSCPRRKSARARAHREESVVI